MRNTYVLYAMLLLWVFSCQEKTKEKALSAEYIEDITSYRESKDDGRKAGYLKLCGLLKLDVEAQNTFGKDTTNTISLPIESISAHIGTFSFNDEGVTFNASETAKVTNEKDSIITSVSSALGPYGSDVQLYHDRLKFQVIIRSGQHFLRVWDSLNPAIAAFKGFQYYSMRPDFIIEGEFTYYEKIKDATVKSKLGLNASTQFIGKVAFDFNGTAHELEVGQDGFLMVTDETTGDETYGGGRYIYLDLPKQNGLVQLDFNKLYNPPCSFSEFTTCLYPPRGNHLPFKIEAGEQMAVRY